MGNAKERRGFSTVALKLSSIVMLRDAGGAAYGFDCSCGHNYTAPSSTAQNIEYRANLVDCMIRYHEAKHKAGKIK